VVFRKKGVEDFRVELSNDVGEFCVSVGGSLCEWWESQGQGRVSKLEKRVRELVAKCEETEQKRVRVAERVKALERGVRVMVEQVEMVSEEIERVEREKDELRGLLVLRESEMCVEGEKFAQALNATLQSLAEEMEKREGLRLDFEMFARVKESEEERARGVIERLQSEVELLRVRECISEELREALQERADYLAKELHYKVCFR